MHNKDTNQALPGVKFRTLPNNTTALHFTSFHPPPTALSITIESRLETLKHYKLAFESKDYYPNNCPRIYINFALDTIYLDSQTFDLLNAPHRQFPYIDPINPLLRFLDSTTKANTKQIKSLAIDSKIWLSSPVPQNARTGLPSEREGILAENARALRVFEGLEELVIVHHGIGISVPCAYSYLRRYELHKAFIMDRKSRWPLFGPASVLQYQYQEPYLSSMTSGHQGLSEHNTPTPDIFVRYLDKPAWSPHKKVYSPVLRGDGMGVRNALSKKEFDARYNEVGEVPIYGRDLEELERGELKFFELEGEGRMVDFMDGVIRGCVEEDRWALEREAVYGGGAWRVPTVRSVGLIRGGQEC